jgi:hypothetical protein
MLSEHIHAQTTPCFLKTSYLIMLPSLQVSFGQFFRFSNLVPQCLSHDFSMEGWEIIRKFRRPAAVISNVDQFFFKFYLKLSPAPSVRTTYTVYLVDNRCQKIFISGILSVSCPFLGKILFSEIRNAYVFS